MIRIRNTISANVNPRWHIDILSTYIYMAHIECMYTVATTANHAEWDGPPTMTFSLDVYSKDKGIVNL